MSYLEFRQKYKHRYSPLSRSVSYDDFRCLIFNSLYYPKINVSERCRFIYITKATALLFGSIASVDELNLVDISVILLIVSLVQLCKGMVSISYPI